MLGLSADLALRNTDLQRILTTDVPDYGVVVQVVGLLTLPRSVSGAVTRPHGRGLPAWVVLIVFLPLFGQLPLLVLTGFVRGEPRPTRYGPPTGAPPTAAGEPLYVPPPWN